MTYYVNTMHGFVRDIRFVHNETGAHVFSTTKDVRDAMSFPSFDDAERFITREAMYQGHYTILQPAACCGQG